MRFHTLSEIFCEGLYFLGKVYKNLNPLVIIWFDSNNIYKIQR